MKKLLIAASVLALTACSAPSEPQLTINPQPVISAQPTAKGQALSIESRDLRTAQFIAVVDSGRQNVQPLHATQNLRVTLEEALSRQLRSQGYTLTESSQGTLRLDILEAIVNVKHSVMSHEMTTKLQLQLVVESPKGKFVKRYSGKSARNGAMSASVEDMEEAMNNLISAVLKDIYADPDLNTYMQENL
ncbi:Putative lipoprotein YajG precursor [Photobacterium marinum]|uniref:Putative lipoprotein YajG n=1 Tax=Photobacterium marinum TaxID=1056511 RepID=L8JCF6_9GAMM|nr:YajG family lipoprotein [Photobacterium marinum]ELR65199.1 Putative lipoprotein YajG precursor [Photobacterium marinum]